MKLNGHEYVKGTFIAPFNLIENLRLNNWHRDRLPEYFWMALIFDQNNDRQKSFIDIKKILQFIITNIDKNFGSPFISKILTFSEESQEKLYHFIHNLGYKDCFSCLTLFLKKSNYQIFNRNFLNSDSIEARIKKCEEIIKKYYDHNSVFSTDIRYMALISMFMSGRLKIMENQVDTIDSMQNYPYVGVNTVDYRKYSSLIRSMEASSSFGLKDCFFHKLLWRDIGKMVDSNIMNFSIDPVKDEGKQFVQYFKNIILYYDDLLNINYSGSDKEIVLFGLLNYSYTRFKEMFEHHLFNEPSGRACMRTIIESYLLTLYLIDESQINANIFKEFREYGAGEYKLTSEASESIGFDSANTHIDKKHLMIFASSEKDPLFTNMDVKYFAKLKMKDIAKKYKEDALYLMYQHDSNFDHCLWCSIVESSLLFSDSSGNEYGKRLGVDTTNRLISVCNDSTNVIKKHISKLNELYPIPERIHNE